MQIRPYVICAAIEIVFVLDFRITLSSMRCSGGHEPTSVSTRGEAGGQYELWRWSSVQLRRSSPVARRHRGVSVAADRALRAEAATARHPYSATDRVATARNLLRRLRYQGPLLRPLYDHM